MEGFEFGIREIKVEVDTDSSADVVLGYRDYAIVNGSTINSSFLEYTLSVTTDGRGPSTLSPTGREDTMSGPPLEAIRRPPTIGSKIDPVHTGITDILIMGKRKSSRSMPATLDPGIWQVKLPKNGVDKPRKKGLRREWSKEEDTMVRKWYPVKGSAYLEVLLGRPRSSIQHRAERLGIPGTKRPWTRKEELFLERNYGKLTAAAIARRLNRTEQSVRGKLNIAGLTGTGGQPWTEGEIAYLTKQYGTAPVSELAVELGRTPEAVELKAGRLGLRRSLHKLTKEEKEWIVRHLGKMSYESIAKKYGVSPQRIQRIAHANGYRPRPYMREWTEHDVDYLRKHYGTKPRKEIAVALGRSVATVQMKACKLGLTNPDEHGNHRRWRSHEEEMLKDLYRKKTQQEIALMLNRTVRSVSGKLQMMGLVTSRKRDVGPKSHMQA